MYGIKNVFLSLGAVILQEKRGKTSKNRNISSWFFIMWKPNSIKLLNIELQGIISDFLFVLQNQNKNLGQIGLIFLTDFALISILFHIIFISLKSKCFNEGHSWEFLNSSYYNSHFPSILLFYLFSLWLHLQSVELIMFSSSYFIIIFI